MQLRPQRNLWYNHALPLVMMQDTVIGDNAKVNCVIADKDVSIKHSVELSGAPNFPVYLSKKTRI